MKIATIGTGIIVDAFLDAVKQVENVECLALYSRKELNAEPFAEKYEINKIYTDLDDLFSDTDIDTIYIASPNSLHYEQAYKALNAGKHVICEKPFTSNLRELNHLIEVARKKDLFLFEAITTIHMPNFKLLKEYIEKIGRIRLIQCNYSQYSSRYDKLLDGELPNIFNLEFSGGALMDINLYNLFFVLTLFGKPTKTHYFANKHKNGIDTSGVAVLEYQDFIAHCSGAKDSNSMNFAMIQGEKGYLKVKGSTNECQDVEVVLNDRTIEQYNNQLESNRLVYELKNIAEIVEHKDKEKSFQLLEYSKLVMKVLDDLRIDAGIEFHADRED